MRNVDSKRSILGLVLCGLVPLATPVHAQDRVIHDTLGPDLPTGVTCGFCAGERFGVVFRELPPPRQGLVADDFPLTLEAVQIAVASATVSAGPRCAPAEVGGVVMAPVEVYAGEEPPTGSIASLPTDAPWSETETLVWAADAPLTLSTASADGTGYNVQFNLLEIADESGMPIRIESGRYVRVVVTLPSSGDACLAGSGESPAAFPIRDGDGVVASERSFLYASGLGWLWNEDARVTGDWGIRLEVTRAERRPDAGVDAGSDPRDAGTVARDAGMLDANVRIDGGVAPAGGGCTIARGATSAGPVAFILGLIGLVAMRRRRAR